MRYLLVALMMVLLPLRGWAGNAMAVDMAAQQVLLAQTAPPAAVAAVEKEPESAMPSDCTMHVQATADKAGAGETTAGSHCNGCNTCQLCLALGSFSWTSGSANPFQPHAAPSASPTLFSSAESAASLKPPIS